VLVTGGSRGIGAACCRLFAEAGAAVAVHYRTGRGEAQAVAEALPEVRSVAGDDDHLPHLTVGADVSDAGEVAALFDDIVRRWGGLDHLVVNAGVWWPTAVDEPDLSASRSLWEVNVVGAFAPVTRAVPLLRDAAAAGREPSIVTVTSTAAQRGEAGYGAYAASKGALVSATKSWAVELAPEIRVNSVAPGWVDTEMVAAALDGDGGGERARAEAEIPLRRIATPDDVAGPVLFLASPLARHVTGEIVNVNGGSVLPG
jgi:3-oxoacyl-[acyl-carrier protein] reductase